LGNTTKFSSLPKQEKKLLIFFIMICLLLPFSFSDSLIEIFSHSLPLFTVMHLEAGYWIASGKPLWQTYLACYGVSTVEMFIIYFGFLGIRIMIGKTLNWLKRQLQKGMRIPFSQNQILILKKKTGYQALNSFANKKKHGFATWLGKQSIVVILVFFFFPVFDAIATAVLGLRKLQYGHWYLAAANLLRIFILVIAMTLGINFTISHFFS